jgi:hypothetical protein
LGRFADLKSELRGCYGGKEEGGTGGEEEERKTGEFV